MEESKSILSDVRTSFKYGYCEKCNKNIKGETNTYSSIDGKHSFILITFTCEHYNRTLEYVENSCCVFSENGTCKWVTD